MYIWPPFFLFGMKIIGKAGMKIKRGKLNSKEDNPPKPSNNINHSEELAKTQEPRVVMDQQDNRKPYWIHETTVQTNDRLVLSKKMLRSKAFVQLTGAAKQMLLELYTRLKLDSYKPGRRYKESQKFYAKNNGKLVLSYKSIHKQFGYSTATISKAIDRLVANGFIEIAELGCGVKRQSHKIALIWNWQDYGTKDFWPGKGKSKMGPVNRGFKKQKRAVISETTSETKVVPRKKRSKRP